MKKTNYLKILLLAVILLVSNGMSWGQVYVTFSGTGNWSETARWDTGLIPTTTQSVIINGEATINLNVEVAGLTINSGKTLTVNAAKQLTVSGILTNNGTLNLLSNVTDGSATILTGSAFTTDPIVCGAYIAPDVWKEFMCYNLGANTSLDPMTYSDGINGDLYQWGRPADGHEKRNSVTTSTLASSNTPGHANFILTSDDPHDWRSGGGNDDRWTNETKGVKDPCPCGFKVPSKAQWAGVMKNNQQGSLANGYNFGDKLFLPASGYRFYNDGTFYNVGSDGYYWSSTVDGANAYILGFSLYHLNMSSSYKYRSNGYSVRCIAEDPKVPTLSTTAIVSSITETSATSGGTITSDGGSAVTARGVCWSTNENPTVDLTTKTTDGSGTENLAVQSPD